jgi:crotonobetainyl-CoA:carnitine CoA-transferase CaiB-like acyl-CoA transferase
MDGIRVVEMGFWVAGPSAAGILADWGADVIKIEPPTGDPFRGLFGLDVTPQFELDNRGKRSVALNLNEDSAREIAHALVEAADVFVTNIRPPVLERWGLDHDTLLGRNPRLVYASVTGYGLAGDERDRAAYDVGAYWSRAGIAAALTPEGSDPPMQRGGMGDHTAGLAAAGGVAAALLHREKTGRGQLVSTSLLRIGMYTLGWDTNSALRQPVLPITAMTRKTIPNPIINSFRDSQGRWFWMLCLEGDRHWPDVCRAIGRPEWIEDERFNSLVTRWQNASDLVDALDEIFAKKTIAEWGRVFDRENVWWAPVQTADEVVKDPQAIAAGAIIDTPEQDGSTGRMIASPVDFSVSSWTARLPVPELGQHTEEVLQELGRDWDEIIKLKEQGAIP